MFDDWPAKEMLDPLPVTGASTPVLGRAKTDTLVAGSDAVEDQELWRSNQDPHRWMWMVATVLLVLLSGVHMAWTFRQPLSKIPQLHAFLNQAGWLKAPQSTLLHRPDQIKLISRDMHSHPTRSGILVLSLTVVNLAPGKQVFPQLEITLLDSASQAVARRRLQPQEYLRPGSDTAAGLASDTWLPILLELGDPGAQASGFEIRFL